MPLIASLTEGDRSVLFRQTLRGGVRFKIFIFRLSANGPNSLYKKAETTVPVNDLYTHIIYLKQKNVKKKLQSKLLDCSAQPCRPGQTYAFNITELAPHHTGSSYVYIGEAFIVLLYFP